MVKWLFPVYLTELAERDLDSTQSYISLELAINLELASFIWNEKISRKPHVILTLCLYLFKQTKEICLYRNRDQ